MTRRRRPQREAPLPDPWRGMPPEANPAMREAVMAAVDKQLASGDPPEASRAFERLVAGGHTPEGARQLIATAVMYEIVALMARGERHDPARLAAALDRLPELQGRG
jgi:hypothetical protein